MTTPFLDPYDDMTDAEFVTMVDAILDKPKAAVPIGLRVPPELLADIKAIAHDQNIPYQTLMKRMLSGSVAVYRKRQTGRKAASAKAS